MPILEPRHDLAHPVEADTAWSESYYFNAYDPGTDSGFFTRIGIRPNEGTMDVGMSVWLPGGELAEYRHVKEQREMVDTVLDVGRRPLRDARAAGLVAHHHGRRGAGPTLCRGGDCSTHPVHLALDVRFDARDAGHRHRRSAERAAALGPGGRGGGHGGQGPPRAGRALDRVARGRRRASRVAGRPRQPGPLLGAPPLGRSDDVALVQHQRGRGHCTSAGSGWAPRPATCTGAGSGTGGAGDQRCRVARCAPSWPTTR